MAPGVYDLMNVPQWSWREVFAYEAGLLGLGVQLEHVPDAGSSGIVEIGRSVFAPSLMSAARTGFLYRVVSRILPTLPFIWYRRFKATYSVKSAGREIAELKRKRPTMLAVFRKPVGRRFPALLTPTVELLGNPGFRLSSDLARDPWPDDLPLHVPHVQTLSIG